MVEHEIAGLGRPMHPAPSGRGSASWLVAFVLLQFVCQVALLFDALAGFRIFFRGLPLRWKSRPAGLRTPGGRASLPGDGRSPRSAAVLCLAFFHPQMSSPLAAVAQWALYLAILAPIYWAGRLHLTVRTVTHLFLLLWAFHTVSALFGVLQVYYPGQFQPALSKTLEAYGSGYTESLKFTLADGQRVWRPMGLTDQPSGAGASGLSAILLGLGLMLSAPSSVGPGGLG